MNPENFRDESRKLQHLRGKIPRPRKQNQPIPGRKLLSQEKRTATTHPLIIVTPSTGWETSAMKLKFLLLQLLIPAWAADKAEGRFRG